MLPAAALAVLTVWASPGAAGGVPVLVYHQVVADGESAGPTRIPLARFREQMDHLAEAGYRTLDVEGLLAALAGEETAGPSVMISLDDGWASQQAALEGLRCCSCSRAAGWATPGATT